LLSAFFFSRYGTCSLPVYQISEEEKKSAK